MMRRLILSTLLIAACEGDAPTSALRGQATLRDALDTTVWEQRVVSPAPPPRQASAMAYDSLRGKTVLFGGSDDDGGLGDTWEWDGISWTQVSDAGPGARDDMAMTFDSARGKTVLFGGYDFTTFAEHLDTWEWDGLSWAQVADSGPPNGFLYSLAYDEARQRSVLIGNVVDNETWEWDGTQWLDRGADLLLEERALVSISYDSIRQRTVVFGGSHGGSVYDDTLEVGRRPNGRWPLMEAGLQPGKRRALGSTPPADEPFCSAAPTPPAITSATRGNGMARRGR